MAEKNQKAKIMTRCGYSKAGSKIAPEIIAPASGRRPN